MAAQKKIIDKTKNEKNVVEVVLVHCHLVDNQYQQKAEVLYTFMCNKYVCLLNGEPSNLTILKTYTTEYDEFNITVTDQMVGH